MELTHFLVHPGAVLNEPSSVLLSLRLPKDGEPEEPDAKLTPNLALKDAGSCTPNIPKR